MSRLLCCRVPKTVVDWPARALHRIIFSLSRSLHHCPPVSIFLEVAVFSPTSICYICIFTDGPEASWEARWQHPKPNLDYNPKDCADNFVTANGLSRQQVHDRQKPLWFIIKYERLNTQHMHVCFLLTVFISS